MSKCSGIYKIQSINISHISCVLNGKRNHAGGYLWKFKNVA